MLETLLGGLLGGVFRIIPELLKWLDRKDERKHELEMQDRILQAQKLQGEQKLAEIRADADRTWDSKSLDALIESIKGQEQLSGVRWIDGWNKLIRPLMATQWVIILYPAFLLASFWLAVQQGTPALDALIKTFGPEEKAFASAIANFYILNRVFAKREGQA